MVSLWRPILPVPQHDSTSIFYFSVHYLSYCDILYAKTGKAILFKMPCCCRGQWMSCPCPCRLRAYFMRLVSEGQTGAHRPTTTNTKMSFRNTQHCWKTAMSISAQRGKFGWSTETHKAAHESNFYCKLQLQASSRHLRNDTIIPAHNLLTRNFPVFYHIFSANPSWTLDMQALLPTRKLDQCITDTPFPL